MATMASRTEIRCKNGHPLFRVRRAVDDGDVMRPANLDKLDPRVRFAPGIVMPTCPVCGVPLMEEATTHKGIKLRSDAVKVAG